MILQLRNQHANDANYKELVAAADAAQTKLESKFPQLFVSDEKINEMKKAAAEAVKNDPEYKAARDERAAAYRAQQDYLFKIDKRLAELSRQLEKN
ncbi:MAG: hypothetical protein AAF585_27770, partial [Verrucomicrobiota bacterium]